mgnify:CR=1 FL=1
MALATPDRKRAKEEMRPIEDLYMQQLLTTILTN